MSTNRHIVQMVEEIGKKVARDCIPDGVVDGVYIAEILSVNPLTIRMYDLSITKNLYINPALMLDASDSGTAILQPFSVPFEPLATYEFLKTFHQKYVVKKGDSVVVCKTGTSFYIAGKAVKV